MSDIDDILDKDKRAKDMKENPDNYVNVKEVIVMVKRKDENSHQLDMYVGEATRQEYQLSKAEIDEWYIAQMAHIRKIEYEKKMKEKKIQAPDLGMRRFLNRGKIKLG